MVRVILDTYIEGSTEREIHIRYDKAAQNDLIIMTMLNDLLCNEQPLCRNCVNYHEEDYLCGYCTSSCKIHGNIEARDHPYHDGDGSKCPDYMREIVKDRKRLKRLRKYYKKLLKEVVEDDT